MLKKGGHTPVASRFSIAILVLNAFTALVITIMTLVVDWHFDLHIPAYAEYAWVATVLCIEISQSLYLL